MNADGLVRFTAGAKQLAQGDVRLYRLAIDVEGMDEGIDGFVGLLVE